MSITLKHLKDWEETPIPISPMGKFKRELIALARAGLAWKRACQLLGSENELKSLIAQAGFETCRQRGLENPKRKP